MEKRERFTGGIDESATMAGRSAGAKKFGIVHRTAPHKNPETSKFRKKIMPQPLIAAIENHRQDKRRTRNRLL